MAYFNKGACCSGVNASSSHTNSTSNLVPLGLVRSFSLAPDTGLLGVMVAAAVFFMTFFDDGVVVDLPPLFVGVCFLLTATI